MNKYFKIVFICIFFFSCSSRNSLTYIQNAEFNNSWPKANKKYNDKIQDGDVLKIDISSLDPEASTVYNKQKTIKSVNDLNIMKLEGYLVDDSSKVNLPILGNISTKDLNVFQLEHKIRNILIDDNHLINPIVLVRRLNFKFTVLGEVSVPGTYDCYDERLNIFQALGYCGDLTIDSKKKDITLIRYIGNSKKVYKIDLTDRKIIDSDFYYVKNNDVIIVNPSFSKVKSAGFIGNPQSITSLASLLLSITLLITNSN